MLNNRTHAMLKKSSPHLHRMSFVPGCGDKPGCRKQCNQWRSRSDWCIGCTVAVFFLQIQCCGAKTQQNPTKPSRPFRKNMSQDETDHFKDLAGFGGNTMDSAVFSGFCSCRFDVPYWGFHVSQGVKASQETRMDQFCKFSIFTFVTQNHIVP